MDVVEIIKKFGEYMAMLLNYIKEFLANLGFFKDKPAEETTTEA